MINFQSDKNYHFLIPDANKMQFCLTAAKLNLEPDNYPHTHGECEILGKHMCITVKGSDPAIEATAALAL